MDRLTVKTDEGYIAKCRRLDNGEFAGHKLCVDKLGKLEDLEEQGLLLKLPCKVGDTVYCLMSADTRIVETTILWIEKHSNCLVFALAGGFGDVVSEHLEKKWFLTREEAETKLKEMEGKE